MTISVLLADDHMIYREQLHSFLDITPGIHVSAESNNGSDTLTLCERFKPEVVVLDWVMSGMSGLEVTKHLAAEQPKTHIVILSTQANEACISSAFQNGACGFILKDDSIIQLVKAVYAAAKGHRYYSPTLRKMVLKLDTEKAESPAEYNRPEISASYLLAGSRAITVRNV
jgi:DNA-binding NarL/FixJ family response regulator